MSWLLKTETFDIKVEISSNVSNDGVMAGESFSIECKAFAPSSGTVVIMTWMYDKTKVLLFTITL